MYNFELSSLQMIDPDDIVVKEFSSYRITRNKFWNFSTAKEIKIFFVEEPVTRRVWWSLFLLKKTYWERVESRLYHWPVQFENFTQAQAFAMVHDRGWFELRFQW